jgi:preprotein translocase subunit SecD
MKWIILRLKEKPMAHRMQNKPISVTLDTGVSATVANATTSLNGYLRGVKVRTPATVDSSATVTVIVIDGDGDTIFTKSAVAANTTTQDYLGTGSIPLEMPVAGNYTVRATYSATQTANRTTTVILLVEQLI